MRVILILILTAMMLSSQAFGQTKQKKGRISATLSVTKKKIYHQEVFKIKISIRTENVRLGEGFEILSLPSEDILELRDYVTMPLNQRISGSSIIEEHVFIYDAYAGKVGKITLKPIIRVGIKIRRRVLFGTRITESDYDLPAEPLILNISPLPEAPANFSGAVGKFNFNTSITPLDVAPGDIIKSKITISGGYNLEKIKPIAISPGRNFKAYNSKLLEDSPKGTIAFEQVLIPQNTNATVVPAVEFTYFDPEQGQYLTKRRGPFDISFHKKTLETVEYFKPDEDISSKPKQQDKKEEKHKEDSIKIFMKKMKEGTLFCKDTMTESETQARLAPSPRSRIMFEIPEGAKITIISRHRNWTEISWQNNRGWVPQRILQQKDIR